MNYTSEMTHMHQDNLYDFDESALSPLPEDQSEYMNQSSSLTPLWNSWNITSGSPQDSNVSFMSDPLLEFISPSTSVSVSDHQQQWNLIRVPIVAYQACYQQPEQQQSQQSPIQSPLQEEGDIQMFLDSTFAFDLEPFNEHVPSNDDNCQQYTSQSGFTFTQQSSKLRQHQQSQGKRKSYQPSSGSSGKKKRFTSRSQQPKDKKDLIASVIASLPQSVLEEQQKAIPTAFPSRMRQTRIQAAIKAQTDAIVQSCQQRILKNNISDLTATSGGPIAQGNGNDGQQVQYIGAYTLEERRLRIARFHEKRKQRVWHHTVKYNCRRKLAVGRVRVKGRFVKTEAEQK